MVHVFRIVKQQRFEAEPNMEFIRDAIKEYEKELKEKTEIWNQGVKVIQNRMAYEDYLKSTREQKRGIFSHLTKMITKASVNEN